MVELLVVVGATFVFCLGSGFIPFVNAELYLVLIALEAGSWELPFVVLAAAAGQTVAKSIMFGASHGASALWGKQRLARWRARAKRWENRPYALVFVSASVGLPPLYIVSVLAGILRLRFRAFVIATFVGRTIRFAACVVAPLWVQSMIG